MVTFTPKEIEDFWTSFIDEHTPATGNKCKKCGGRVVCKVAGDPPNGIRYWEPACEKCSHQYPYAENAPRVGAEEYIKLLRTPTI